MIVTFFVDTNFYGILSWGRKCLATDRDDNAGKEASIRGAAVYTFNLGMTLQEYKSGVFKLVRHSKIRIGRANMNKQTAWDGNEK